MLLLWFKTSYCECQLPHTVNFCSSLICQKCSILEAVLSTLKQMGNSSLSYILSERRRVQTFTTVAAYTASCEKSANSWWQMIQLIWACIKCYLQELDKDQDAGVCNIVTHHLNHPLGDNHIAPSRNKGSVACFFFHLLILRCLLKKSEHLLCCWYTFGILEAMWKVFWLIFKVDVFNYEDILDFLHFGYSKLNWV